MKREVAGGIVGAGLLALGVVVLDRVAMRNREYAIFREETIAKGRVVFWDVASSFTDVPRNSDGERIDAETLERMIFTPSPRNTNKLALDDFDDVEYAEALARGKAWADSVSSEFIRNETLRRYSGNDGFKDLRLDKNPESGTPESADVPKDV